MEVKKFYTVAEFYRDVIDKTVALSTIYAHIRAGKIPVRYFGSKPLIPATYVDEFLNGKLTEAS